MPIISIFDIGTKSLKHYIFRDLSGRPELLLYRRYSEANLGGEALISQATENRLLELLRRCLEENRRLGVNLTRVLGTAIFRESAAARELAEKIGKMAGAKLEILSQDREAFYLYRGFVPQMAGLGSFAVANIGGGSTEIAGGEGDNPDWSKELDFGVNFLRASFGQGKVNWEEIDSYVDKKLEGVAPYQAPFFISGTFDFLSEVAPKLGISFSANHIPGHPLALSPKAYRTFRDKLRAIPPEELAKLYPQDPRFTDNVAISQSVYGRIAEKLRVSAVIPSRNDLVDGVVEEMRG